jgi:hypothetical protein
MSDNNPVSDTSNTAGRTQWLAIGSTIVTIVLTALNAFWSHQISVVEIDLKKQQVEFQSKLDSRKLDLERYVFVQQLLDGVSKGEESQKTLTVSLINLALNPEEAEQFFSGLGSKDSKGEMEKVATLGNELVNQKYTIYLHLGKHDNSEQESLNPTRDALNLSGFRIAGYDDQRDTFGPGVDYFYEKDKLGAEKVVDILNKLRKPNEKPFVARPHLEKKIQKEGTLGIWF